MSSTEHLYDTSNCISSQSWQLGDTTYSESYTYDGDDGSLVTMSPAVGGDVTFTYDALKRLSNKTTDTFQQVYTYRAISDTQTTTQVSKLQYKKVNSNSLSAFSLNYTYDSLGNIAAIDTGFLNGDAAYTYDSQSQLIGETNYKGTFTYTYDTYGNIRSVSDGTTTYEYAYEDTNGWKDLLTSYRGHTISYDEIGNPLNWYNTSAWNFTWQNGRQLASSANTSHTVSYTYDAAGIRDSKTVDGVTYNYITQNGQVVRQTWTEDETSHVMDFIYDNQGKPYALVYDGTTYYYELNLQGDVIRIIDSTGATICTYTYDAWGKILNSSSNAIFKSNPIRYRGYYYDTETGLYYLGSRYYDPAVKRFINSDTSNLITANPYGLTDKNLFAYCDNNPVMRKDDGGEFWNIVVGAVVGGLIAGISTALECSVSGEYSTSQIVGQALISAAFGAVGGAVAGTGLGVLGQIGVSTALSSTEYCIRQKAAGKTITKEGIRNAAIAGAYGGIAGGDGAAYGVKHITTQRNYFVKNIQKLSGSLGKNLKGAANAFSKYASQTWRYSQKHLVKSTLKGIAKAFAGNKLVSILSA